MVLDTPGTSPGRGLCLERHDLVASKLAAGREKDFEFAGALLRDRAIDAATLQERVTLLPLDETRRARLIAWIRAWS